MIDTLPALLTVPEACRYLRISRNTAYDLVARGHLPAIRLGRKILIPRLALEAWVEQAITLAAHAPGSARQLIH
jgi:excisionase family DNA binding protein